MIDNRPSVRVPTVARRIGRYGLGGGRFERLSSTPKFRTIDGGTCVVLQATGVDRFGVQRRPVCLCCIELVVDAATYAAATPTYAAANTVDDDHHASVA